MVDPNKKAFPVPCNGNHPNDLPCGCYHNIEEGMTLREYYAGQFMAGMLRDKFLPYNGDHIAQQSVKYANSLIKALSERPDPVGACMYPECYPEPSDCKYRQEGSLSGCEAH